VLLDGENSLKAGLSTCLSRVFSFLTFSDNLLPPVA